MAEWFLQQCHPERSPGHSLANDSAESKDSYKRMRPGRWGNADRVRRSRGESPDRDDSFWMCRKRNLKLIHRARKPIAKLPPVRASEFSARAVREQDTLPIRHVPP